MAKPNEMNPQNGFKYSELKLGGVYECRISKRLCLIVKEDKPVGFRKHDAGIELQFQHFAKVYNSTTGLYDTFTPFDYQLKFPS